MRKNMYLALGFGIIALIVLAGFSFSQNDSIGPVMIGEPMHDFTLPIYQGGEISLSNLKGRMVMLIFPRGKFKPDEWCHLGMYKYVELCDFVEENNIKEKLNLLEIFYVISYNKEMIDDWFDELPQQLKDIENWKNPPDADNLTGRRKVFLERVRRTFPKKYAYKKGEIPMPIPILIDEEAKLSSRLGIFSPGWNGGEGPQNIPSVYIVDVNGILRFKYLAQNTWDRPGYDYLMRVTPCAFSWGRKR